MEYSKKYDDEQNALIDPFRKMLSSGGLTFFYRMGGVVFTFIITFFITRYYGEGVYGNFSLIFTLLQAASMIFALGLPNAVISYLGLHQIEDNFSQYLLKKGLKILIIASILPCILFYLLKDFIAWEIFNNGSLVPYLAIVAITLPIYVIHEFILNFFVATKKFQLFSIFMFVVPNAFFLLLLVIFSLNRDNEVIIISSYALAVVITLIIELFFAFKKPVKGYIGARSSLSIIKFSWPMMLSSLMIFLLNWTDIFMLGAMVTEEEVGIYNLAYKLASIAMLIFICMNVVFAPKISELYKSNKMDELHKIVIKTTRTITAISIPMMLILLFFGEYILRIFGENFIEGKLALNLILIGFLIKVMTGNVDQLLNMTNHQGILKNLTISGFGLNVLLNYFLIPKYGINGAATASLITTVAFNVACLIYIKKKLGFYTFV